MTEVTPPLFLDVDSTYGADDLGQPYRDLIGEGVVGYEDLRVRQRAAGANMSVDVGSGVAWVMGDESLQQPRYRCYNDATKNVTVTAADATNPRIDLVIAEVRDAVFSGAFNDWRLRVVAGTPSGGATLDNRTGAAALPNNSILLADVLVPNGDTTVGDAEIRDRRPFAVPGVVPPLLTKVDQMSLIPHASLSIATNALANSTLDLYQTAILVCVPRRIVSATRLRWRYLQGATALTGTYNIAVYDASGRRIVEVGATAYTGAANSFQVRSETISATTFEAGSYYLLWGQDTTNAGTIRFSGALLEQSPIGTLSAIGPNIALSLATGGTTTPTTLLSMGDINANVGANVVLPGIIATLSVG